MAPAWTRLLVLGLLAAACSPYGGGSFRCADDTQCASGAFQGLCEPSGFCSFDDGTCASGRRYGDSAGGGLAGVCVGDEPADAPPDSPVAADGGADGPAGGDGPGPDASVALCEPAPGLVVCYRFEGNLTDESGNGNDATPSTETYVAGQAGQAMRSIANTESRIAESPDLDVSQLTIEMWIRPTQIPAAGRAGLFDNDGQYGFFLLPGGNLQCTGGGAVPTNVVGAVAADVWTHVACTYDGATRIVYVNGAAGGTTPSGSPLALTGTNGSALAGNAPTGDPLLGDVDSFRLWGVVRSPVEICQAAGCP